jgi:replicative DNA helicase
VSYSPELYILKLFIKDKDSFDLYYPQIKEFNYDVEIKTILFCINKYYVNYPTHLYIGKEELRTYYNSMYPLDKNKQIVSDILDTIYSIEVSDSIIRDIIKNIIEKEISLAIIGKLTSVITENKYGVLPTVTEDIAKFDQLIVQQDPEEIFVSSDIEELLEIKKQQGIIKWRNPAIQEALKGVCGATLGHVFARPETGKTSFLASELTYMSRQFAEDECALWCNNEQEKSKVVMRNYTAMLNQPEDVIINNISRARDAYLKNGGYKIKLYDNAYISIDMLRKLIKTFRPRIVVIDQGDKVIYSGASKLDGHVRLKELYRQFRELAKEFNTHILTVGQASGEAEGKRWLQMTHMDMSKTGKPGEMDYVLGIGKESTEGEDTGLRYFHFCKNKEGKHSKFVLQLNSDTGRYNEI